MIHVDKVHRGGKPKKVGRCTVADRREAGEGFDEAVGAHWQDEFFINICGPWKQRKRVERVLKAAIKALGNE